MLSEWGFIKVPWGGPEGSDGWQPESVFFEKSMRLPGLELNNILAY
jgi:hypothetical protein